MADESNRDGFDFGKAVNESWSKPVETPTPEASRTSVEPDLGEKQDELFPLPEELKSIGDVKQEFDDELERVKGEQLQGVLDAQEAKVNKKQLKKETKSLRKELKKKNKEAKKKEIGEDGEVILFDEEATIEEKLQQIEKITAALAEGKLTKKRQKELVKAIRKDKRRAVFRAAGKWLKTTTTIKKHEKLTPEEKAERRKKIINAAVGLAILGSCITTWFVLPLFQGFHLGDLSKDNADQFGLGAGEAYHEQYHNAAEAAWARYASDGPTPGGMFDPMAVNDTDTKLLTGYFPGWFCVPQRVTICEEMLGVKLDVPEKAVAQESYFYQMRENWDEQWWPVMKDNPNLTQDVKNFYDPANRDGLRQWYRDTFPMNSQGWLDNQKNVADEKFMRLLTTGKLVPRDVTRLNYSHLLGTFVAEAYLGIKIPMLKDGFLAAGEAISTRVQQAIRSMEEVTSRKDYIFKDIEPYQKIIDQYYARVEKSAVKSGQLKSGGLGRV